jgi:hypothetical protein
MLQIGKVALLVSVLMLAVLYTRFTVEFYRRDNREFRFADGALSSATPLLRPHPAPMATTDDGAGRRRAWRMRQ